MYNLDALDEKFGEDNEETGKAIDAIIFSVQ